FVLGDGLGQLALGFEDLLLERADSLRSVLEPPSQHHDLFLQCGQLALELGDLALLLGESPVLIGCHVVTSRMCSQPLRRTLHRGPLGAAPRRVEDPHGENPSRDTVSRFPPLWLEKSSDADYSGRVAGPHPRGSAPIGRTHPTMKVWI